MSRTPEQIQSDIVDAKEAYDHADRKVGRWMTKRSTEKVRIEKLQQEYADAVIPAEPKSGYARFRKRYRTGFKVYEFAAVKAAGVWWMTGAETRPFTWPELVEFARRDNILPRHTSDPRELFVDQDLPF